LTRKLSKVWFFRAPLIKGFQNDESGYFGQLIILIVLFHLYPYLNRKMFKPMAMTLVLLY
jgi:hypothetical protein